MAATPEDNIVSARLLSFASNLASCDVRVKEAMDRLIASQRNMTDEYVKQLDAQHGWNTTEAKAAKKHLLELNDIAKQESKISQDYVKSMKESQQLLDTINARKKAIEAKLVAEDKTMSVRHKQKYKSELDGLQKQIEDRGASLVVDRKIRDTGRQATKIAAVERNKLEAHQNKLSTQVRQEYRDKFVAAGDSIASSVKGMFSGKAAEALSEGVKVLSLTASTQMGVSFGDSMKTAFLGFKPSEFIQFQADFRRTEQSMIGGQQSFIAGLEAGEAAYRDMIIDPAERSRALAESMQILTTSGVRPTVDSAIMFSNTLHKVAKMTGKDGRAILADLTSVMEEDSQQTLLKTAASDAERQAMVESTNRLYANNIALGMTTKQSMAAIALQNKMQADKAKSRISLGARLQALGGALGKGAQGIELNALSRKKNLSASEKQRNQSLLSEFSNEISKRRGQGLPQELMVDSLVEGLKLEEYLGASSPLNTTLNKAVAPLVTKADETSPAMVKAIELASEALKIKSGVMNNPVTIAALGVGDIMAGMLPTNAILMYIAKKTGMGGPGDVGGKVFDKIFNNKAAKAAEAAAAAKKASDIAKAAQAVEAATNAAKAAQLAEAATVVETSAGLGLAGAAIIAAAVAIPVGLAYAAQSKQDSIDKAAGRQTASERSAALPSALDVLFGTHKKDKEVSKVGDKHYDKVTGKEVDKYGGYIAPNVAAPIAASRSAAEIQKAQEVTAAAIAARDAAHPKNSGIYKPKDVKAAVAVAAAAAPKIIESPKVVEKSKQVDAKRKEVDTALIAEKNQDVADKAKKITIDDQLKKMDTSNDLLKQISENSAGSAAFTEKLLYVMTMSEADRTKSDTRKKLMSGNRFGSQYQYVK